ncbi:MAG: hypothetical protein VKL42_05975 [Snowella sp.]|nr:hypothetical protein [Snowella sp.]
MSNTWDFLIQKDGETEWSKLTDLSSLPAGCYQLAAKSDRPKLNVDIRITYQDLKQANPPQTIASISHHLDHEGFILLLPFTHLAAGQWQIHCFPSILAEMSGATWRTSLQFDITPVELLETPLELPEKSSLLDFFRSMEMPELSPLPDVFTPTPHQFAYLEEAVLTPELEAISQIHYEMEAICQPVNIDAPLTPEPDPLSLNSSATTNSVTVILPESDSPNVPIPEELELGSSSPSVITELPFLDEINAEDDQPILSQLFPSLAELEEIEAEEIQTLFATVSSSELATDINQEETQPICIEELPLLAKENVQEIKEDITQVSTEIPAIPATLSVQDHSTIYTRKREISYLVELSYPDHNRTFTIDVVVTEGDNHVPLDLQLPKLSVMRRRLHITSPKSTKILPPKIYPALPSPDSQVKKKLQFTKLEPLQNVS